jgi:hypothetical protein
MSWHLLIRTPNKGGIVISETFSEKRDFRELYKIEF